MPLFLLFKTLGRLTGFPLYSPYGVLIRYSRFSIQYSIFKIFICNKPRKRSLSVFHPQRCLDESAPRLVYFTGFAGILLVDVDVGSSYFKTQNKSVQKALF
ncbi:MAG: hypothetical protein WC271_10075 [Bacteroidales bacterium]|jgi:hypothetical protein|nr:hypothetical protein [Bacteroidales bacterium]MDD3130960.1 hypothetical protein [Bacteroidales bacterium]MDD4740246.1 hypothetical protein [Bacteroidales bacterium]